MNKTPVWILTFNRPAALSRQIKTWGRFGHPIHVFTNYPKIVYEDQETANYVTEEYFNSLSYEDSNSWCARSWNSIFIKAFKDGKTEDGIFVQDDTDCTNGVPIKLWQNQKQFDFIWAPAGDQFFYMRKSVLSNVGWFDERFNFCYCGDADFLLRVWKYYSVNNLTRISIDEAHDWGWKHNSVGLNIPTGIQSKAVDENYINQNEENQAKLLTSEPYLAAQKMFKAKWGLHGNGINGIGSLISNAPNRQFDEIDWYPWFTKKYLTGEAEKWNRM